jgi:hypothetical protein
MQASTEPDRKPRPKQMRLLRALADQRGESFAYPQSAAEAEAEIRRLRGRRPSSRVEKYVERRAVSRQMAACGGATAIRDSEIVGYGSSARWVGGSRAEV